MTRGRRPGWRGPGERDWGLPEYRRSSLAALARSAIGDVVREAWIRRATRATARRLAAVPDLRLAIGSGCTVPSGWQGLDLAAHGADVYAADLLHGIPAAAESVDALLAEHILEHFWYDDIETILRECHRVLRDGTPIRVVSPDALHVARLLQLKPEERIAQAVATDVEMHRWRPGADVRMLTVNRVAYQWGDHKALLTADAVVDLLDRAGFVGIHVLTTRESHYFETPPDVHPIRFPDEHVSLNFAVEASKPRPSAHRLVDARGRR